MDPKPIDNLIASQRRDGYKRYNEAARSALVEQVVRGEHSIATLARVNGVNANLLHKWVGARHKPLRTTLPKSHKDVTKTSPSMLPVIVKPSLPYSRSGDSAMIQFEVRCKRGTLIMSGNRQSIGLVIEALSV